MDADNHFEIFSLASFGPSLGVMTSTAWEPPTGEDWPLVVELIDRRIQMMGGGRAERRYMAEAGQCLPPKRNRRRPAIFS